MEPLVELVVGLAHCLSSLAGEGVCSLLARHLARVAGVSLKWTVLPVLARPRRWVNGTSRPCSNGCLWVRRRAARRTSALSRRLAVAWMAGPVGWPRAVEGAMSTLGLL